MAIPSSVVPEYFLNRDRDQRRSLASFLPTALLIVLTIAVVGVTVRFSQLPDLRIVKVAIAPATVRPGETIAVTSQIGNGGHADSQATTARFFLASGKKRTPASLQLNGSQPVPALQPSTLVVYTTIVDIPPDVPAGTYYVITCADRSERYLDRNQKNDCIASTTTLVVTSP
jgi:hypothetical protein